MKKIVLAALILAVFIMVVGCGSNHEHKPKYLVERWKLKPLYSDIINRKVASDVAVWSPARQDSILASFYFGMYYCILSEEQMREHGFKSEKYMEYIEYY